MLKVRRLLAAAALAFAAVLFLLPALAARRFPMPETPARGSRFDAIAVLGFPARADGRPTAILEERVAAAVRWYEAGAAPRLVVSGAAAHGPHVEAEVMARVARARGVPAAAIVLEPKARDTRENARFVGERMRAEGWRTVLVVSSPSHLRRAAVLFREAGIDAAFAPAEPEGALGALREAAATLWEATHLLRMPAPAAAGPRPAG